MFYLFEIIEHTVLKLSDNFEIIKFAITKGICKVKKNKTNANNVNSF